ncbi:hypothetical protein D9M71_499470 [compost metagenome]
MGLERLGNRHIPCLQADRYAWHAHFGEACAQRRLPRDECRASGRATVLRVVIGEPHAFIGNPVDVRRFIAHHAVRVGADVGLADVVAEDHQDVGFIGCCGGSR